MTDITQEQIDYYRARAGEYDEWFQREGRYDRGDEANTRWFADIAQLEQRLADLGPLGATLDLAAGTGWWTEKLAAQADSVHCVDASSETIAINQAKVSSDRISYEQADIFAWQPKRRYDTVFFSFWLSHVPADRFEDFWAMIAAALAPGGRAVLIDSMPARDSSARDHVFNTDGQQLRRLNDGREFHIVKRFFTAEELADTLRPLGFATDAAATDNYFLWAVATRGR